MGGEQHDEMPGDAVFAAVSRLRARRSQGGRTRGAGATAYRLYLAFLILAPPIYLVINALGEVPRADAVTIDGLISRLTIVVPLVLLALGIATLRVATWTGPVIITAADVPFMLSLPFPASADAPAGPSTSARPGCRRRRRARWRNHRALPPDRGPAA